MQDRISEGLPKNLVRIKLSNKPRLNFKMKYGTFCTNFTQSANF